MKKSVSVFLSLCLILTLFAGMAMPASANEEFLYTVNGDGAVVTGYAGNAADITVPDTLGGKTVVAVGINAFEDNVTLVSITLPDSVRLIDEAAFMNCTALETIHIGAVKTVAYSAFYGCTALTDVSYVGSETSWKAVSVAAYNEPLLAAAITYTHGTNTVDLLPADPSEFLTLSEGGGSIRFTKQDQGYRFTGTGGWPSAYTRRTEENFVTVDVFSDTYLNFDFTVSGGYSNIILAFDGMDILTMRKEGHYVTLNRLIDPAYVDENGIIYDIGNGTYTASVHVGALGCDPSLVQNGTFTISDIKIYSVEGATVTVRDLSVGNAKYDILSIAQTSYTVKTSQSLLPSKASDFAKAHTDTGSLNIVNTPDGFLFMSTNGWPCAFTKHYLTGDGYLLADPDDYLYYDFTVESAAQAHLAVYFAGADPVDTIAGTYASLNPLIHPNYLDAGGAIVDLNGGNFKGFIRIRDLGCDPALMQNGKVPISDIKIFSVNKWQDSAACIVVRDLSVVTIETYTTSSTTSTTTSTTSTTSATVTAPVVTFSVSVSPQEVVQGDYVEVAFNVSEGHHLINGQLWIDYDPNVLVPQDPFEVGCITEVNKNIFDSSYMWDAAVAAPGRMKFAFASYKLDGTTAGGTMFSLVFKVMGGMNSTVPITLSAPEMSAAVNGVDYDGLHPVFEHGSINVTYRRGDVNFDGWVELDDATAVFYHVNKVRALSGDALSAADVNHDGRLTLYDAARLFYYTNDLLDTL